MPSPQEPQNLTPGGLSCPQARHRPLLWAGAAVMDEPQWLQNLTFGEFSLLQPGHFDIAVDAPQLLQNFPVPDGLPQPGHTVCLLSSLSFQIVAVDATSLILRCIAEERALATETSWRGAQPTHKSSSSL